MPMLEQNPSAPTTPQNPGAMTGTPPHPGPSPVTSGGAGAGNEAAATAMIKAVMPALFKAASAFPVGSKKYKATLSALQALNPVFEGADEKNLVPAAVQQMAMASKGGPLQNASAPGLAASPPGGSPPAAAA